MDDEPKKNDECPKRRVRRYSPDRLLRQPVVLSGGGTVSVEKHRGRKMVRLDEPGESVAAGKLEAGMVLAPDSLPLNPTTT